MSEKTAAFDAGVRSALAKEAVSPAWVARGTLSGARNMPRLQIEALKKTLTRHVNLTDVIGNPHWKHHQAQTQALGQALR